MALRFELASGDAGLPDDRLQGADSELFMDRYGNSNRTMRQFLLHNDMAASPAYFNKAVSFQNSANLFA